MLNLPDIAWKFHSIVIQIVGTFKGMFPSTTPSDFIIKGQSQMPIFH